VADADDLHDQPVVDDVVDDAVVARTNPIRAILTRQLDAARWSWVIRKQIDRGAHPLLVGSRQPLKSPHRPAGDLDTVALAHANPRSALTSSQGM